MQRKYRVEWFQKYSSGGSDRRLEFTALDACDAVEQLITHLSESGHTQLTSETPFRVVVLGTNEIVYVQKNDLKRRAVLMKDAVFSGSKATLLTW